MLATEYFGPKDHRSLSAHQCEESHTKDVRVPVCPLCQQPVPLSKGEDPNIKVDEHIARDCRSDKAKKAYINECSHPGCKRKELVEVICSTCRKKFCLKHRLETDHNCIVPNRSEKQVQADIGPFRVPSSERHAGTSSRQQSSFPRANKSPSSGTKQPQSTLMGQMGAELNRERQLRLQQQRQGSLNVQATPLQPPPHATDNEDEALARAIAASLADGAGESRGTSSSREAHQLAQQQSQHASSAYDEDEALAKAIAASLKEDQKPPKPQSKANTTGSANAKKEDSCVLS
eukprot:Em0022g272a